MKKTLVTGVLISEWEAKQILHCLQYCCHRIDCHDDVGLLKITSKKIVNELKKELKEILYD